MRETAKRQDVALESAADLHSAAPRSAPSIVISPTHPHHMYRTTVLCTLISTFVYVSMSAACSESVLSRNVSGEG